MSNFQKVIKYIAIALAVLIIFSIISLIMNGIGSLGNFNVGNNMKLDKLKVADKYDVLDIELTNVNIVIKEGKKFGVESDSDNVVLKEIGNKLLITEKKSSIIPKRPSSDLIIYVSDNLVFDEVMIENGAGRIDVDYIKTNELELDLGAGKVNINKLYVYHEASIDSGAGEVIVEDGSINNLDFDMGIGKIELNLKITGNSDIDAGVGDMKINLLGNRDDYSLNIDKGVGLLKVDGEKVDNSNIYGNGDNVINIDGGIGNIDVNFK